MTYTITFYSQTGGMAPDLVLAGLVAHAETAGLALCVTGKESGEGWVSGDLYSCGTLPDSSSVRVEIHNNPQLVSAMVAQVEAQDLSGRVKAADTIAILTLSGADVDWLVVRNVWNAIESKWPTAPYDDGSGFDISIDDVG